VGVECVGREKELKMSEMEFGLQAYDEMRRDGEIEGNGGSEKWQMGGEFSIPAWGLFFGVADDGLPVVLNMDDDLPGPILINGAASPFLMNIVNGIEHLWGRVDFGVIGSSKEWSTYKNLECCAGIFGYYERGAEDLILSMAAWAHGNKGSGKYTVLLVEDLEDILRMDYEVTEKFRWLLACGPSRRVWPIVGHKGQTRFDQYFRTEILHENGSKYFMRDGDEMVGFSII
jgi:hypothetical protein